MPDWTHLMKNTRIRLIASASPTSYLFKTQNIVLDLICNGENNPLVVIHKTKIVADAPHRGAQFYELGSSSCGK